METEHYILQVPLNTLSFVQDIDITAKSLSFIIIGQFAIMIVLLLMSALMSGAEVAFFSLSPKNKEQLLHSKKPSSTTVLRLLDEPERLLATILIGNNFINIGIIILSTFITDGLFDFSNARVIGFIFHTVVVTFLILLFGEIIPKVYATQRPLMLAEFIALPLNVSRSIFYPISSLLVKTTSIVNRSVKTKASNVSIDDLSQALDLTDEKLVDDEKILKGIVNFGSYGAKEIMKPRVDVVAADEGVSFLKLQSIIVEQGYSRIPVYSETFDNIKGILYIKDLIPHLDKPDNFHWSDLLRKAYIVPENKKINDLLSEFQKEKIHMAIVVDEYGGTSGIVTMEDILEEVVGEISDEQDEEEDFYTKIDDHTYIFEGKTLINDFYKVIDEGNDIFEEIRGEADTLAGLILEIKGEIPAKNAIINYERITFEIKSVDHRRIKQIKVLLK